MSKKVAFALTAIAVLGLLYPAARLATAQTKPSLLFVQTARKIDYKDGVMTLSDLPHQIMFFTDRPNRVVGNVPTDTFGDQMDGTLSKTVEGSSTSVEMK